VCCCGRSRTRAANASCRCPGARTTEPGILRALSVPELHDYEQQTTSFDAFGWFRGGRFHLTAPGEPQFVPGAAVTPALARQLGPPLLGQWFADDSGAVISSVLWRRLGGRRDIIGSAITLDNRPYTVSGVMPPAFRLPIASLGMGRGNTEVWIPLDPSWTFGPRLPFGAAAASAKTERFPSSQRARGF
jgi:hypothetical protein